MHPIKIINGRIITPYRVLHGATLLITEDKITALSEGDIEAPEAQIIDAAGNYVAPGFIDIHVHGGGGHDFMDGTIEAFLGIAQLHARHGTTSMTPTTLSSEKDELHQILQTYEQVCGGSAGADGSGGSGGAAFIGMHLEGPYFAMNQRGAQDPRYIRDPDPLEYRPLLAQYPSIRRWSAAPELNGALAFAE